jgi:hypothetical protein
VPPPPVIHCENYIENGKLLIAWEGSWTVLTGKGAIKEEKKGLFEVDLQTGKGRALPPEKKITEPAQIIVGDRKFTVVDVTTETKPAPGVVITNTVPNLLATDTTTGKVTWNLKLRGGMTVKVKALAP